MILPVRRRPGPVSALSDEQQAEVWSWSLEPRKYGAIATKARALGIRPETLYHVVCNLKRRVAGE